jgi:hypothetical protein
MASADSKMYLINGGYLQKGTKSNLREADLEKDVQDLLPARYGVHNLNSYIYLKLLIHISQMVSR